MSITFGIYDFFSYMVPGVLYLVVANELLRIFKLSDLSIIQLADKFGNLGDAVLWGIVAYVLGQLMDTFGIRWYTLFNNFSAEIKAMKEFKEKNADLDIHFNLADRKILFSVVRHNKPELAQSIDSFKAISIMLNNVSLALFLFGIVQFISFVRLLAATGQFLPVLLMSLAAFGLSYVAVKRSSLFNEWHWCAVFEHARQFGRSVPEMFGMENKSETAGKGKAHLPKRIPSAAKAASPAVGADPGNGKARHK